jgi:hypothetical protein
VARRRPFLRRRGAGQGSEDPTRGGNPSAGRAPVTADTRECAAPHSALYFEPSGLVTTCCANSAYVLGRIQDDDTSDSLQSIWHGARTAEQRHALDQGDFSLGCDECATGVVAGNRDQVLAREFDRYWDRIGGAYPVFMDFALSNTCNLQCAMCNGDLSSAIRTQREGRPPLRSPYGDQFFTQLEEFLPHLHEASFKGGEPFLARETRRVWDLLLDLDDRPRVTVTTNGTQWNERVEHYVRELQMNVILSVDGTTAATVETIRAGTVFDELQENIERFHAATEDAGGSLVLNYCVMPQNWSEFGGFLRNAERRQLYVHAIPVVAPAGFDLLQRPTDELTGIVAALDAEGAELEPLLERNSGVWQAQLSRLHGELEHRSSASPVQHSEVSIRRDSPDLSEPDLQHLRDELRRTAPSPLLEVELEQGLVVAARSTSWADELLDPAGWIGLGEQDLPGVIAEATGRGIPEIRTEQRSRDILQVTMDLGGEPGLRMRAVVILDASTGTVQRLLIAEPAPLPS